VKASSKGGDPVRRRLFPHTVRGWLITGIAAAVLAVLAVVAVVYLVVFPTSSPAPLALSSPSSTAAVTSAATTDLSGTWNISSGSKAGYRVREQLGGVPALSDAVGRTSAIKGSLTLGGTNGALTVSAASFDVDVSTLTSDDGRRDNRIRFLGLESDQFPGATFSLSTPVPVPATAASGQTVQVTATGALTIHGVTQTVGIPLQARLNGPHIEVTGSITFPWSRFGMEAPNIGGFVSVTDMATMEFDLQLARA
jgi:polyisoprenoid-binding protein YceI